MRRKKQSWEEEHDEFNKVIADLRPGPKWTLGFFQVITDPKSPETKLRNNDLFEFLIPEEYLSLKLYFDNLRNSGICAAFIAFGAWVWGQSPHLLPPQMPTWPLTTIAIAIWAMTGLFLLLNCLQAWILTSELYRSLVAIRVAKTYVYRGNHILKVVLGLIHIAITWVADVIVSIAALLVTIAIIAISIGFVAHTVLSSQGLH